MKRETYAAISRQHKIFSKIIERARRAKPTELSLVRCLCIDIQKAALAVDMTFNTDNTGFRDRRTSE